MSSIFTRTFGAAPTHDSEQLRVMVIGGPWSVEDVRAVDAAIREAVGESAYMVMEWQRLGEDEL